MAPFLERHRCRHSSNCATAAMLARTSWRTCACAASPIRAAPCRRSSTRRVGVRGSLKSSGRGCQEGCRCASATGLVAALIVLVLFAEGLGNAADTEPYEIRVVNEESGNVWLIDSATWQVRATVPLEASPTPTEGRPCAAHLCLHARWLEGLCAQRDRGPSRSSMHTSGGSRA